MIISPQCTIYLSDVRQYGGKHLAVCQRQPRYTFYNRKIIQFITLLRGHSKNMSRLEGREGVRWNVTKCDRGGGGEGFLQHVMSRL